MISDDESAAGGYDDRINFRWAQSVGVEMYLLLPSAVKQWPPTYYVRMPRAIISASCPVCLFTV